MNEIQYEWCTNINKYQRILSFLEKSKDDFFIPLDNRVCINDYALKLSTKANILFAVVNNTDIGCCCIYTNTQKAFITSFSVLKEYQNKHIGSQLLNETLKFLKKNTSCTSVELSTFASDSKAISFYKKNGFNLAQTDDECILLIQSIR